jgi:excisionase family DNA binding protein
VPDEPDRWDARVMITVKEAAWLLSLSEHEIRRAVTNGEIDRVFIGAGTTNYRVVYGSLLAWVNQMPRHSLGYYQWWSRW